MGGKRWEDRKHFLFYCTCLLIFIITGSGCVKTAKKVIKATAKTFQNQPQVQNAGPLGEAENMMNEGNFDGALEAYDEIATKYPKSSPGDRALFDMGIIWAYPDNPKKSYEKALKCFRQLLYYYPKSLLRDEARAWTEAIDRVIRYEGRIKDLEEKKVASQEQINALQENIGALEEQINALKEIDIGIEEKKRKGLPEK